MPIQEITKLKVFYTNKNGCYFRYKNNQEVFLPHRESFGAIYPGDEILLAIFHDAEKNEYTASEKISKYLIDLPPLESPDKADLETRPYKNNQEINAIIYSFSPLGINVALDLKYTGIIFNEEIHRKYELGESIKVFIKKIREDGKIDLSLQKQGYRNFINSNTETIINALKLEGGYIEVNDNSAPDFIQQKFGMSKRKFKIAIGALFKAKKITIEKDGIRIL